LLNLNRLVQHKHLALANRVWPNCTWLEWDLPQIEQHPVIKLILRVFGHDLLDYVIQTFGRDVVLEYWRKLKVPDEYDDIHLEEEDLSPVLNVPDEQMVDNPHSDFEADEGEFFIFGAPETAECFRWLIESRSHYSLYVDNRTGYVNDPMGIRLAYDMRDALKRDYWATLPPDTLPAYLAMAHSLQWATVPEAWQEGRLAAASHHRDSHTADGPSAHRPYWWRRRNLVAWTGWPGVRPPACSRVCAGTGHRTGSSRRDPDHRG
jgi:hypothetical protein